MGPRGGAFLTIIFFLLIAISSPPTIIATSRHILALDTKESPPQPPMDKPPTSNDFDTLSLPNGTKAMPPMPESAIRSCKPKGPVRWSSPSPIRNNLPIC